MDFVSAVRRNLTTAAYADFRGRASRSEYWWFYLFSVLAIFTGALISLAALNLFALALFLPSLATSVRRLHDVGRSGWWLLLGLIPFGGFVVLYWSVKASDPGANRYGEGPATA